MSSGFNAIIDLTLYKGSTPEFVNLHVEAQNLAIEAGLNKAVVILKNNPMLKITIDYILKQSGIHATYLNNFSAAEHFLSLL
jgi:hypothetical protein